MEDNGNSNNSLISLIEVSGSESQNDIEVNHQKSGKIDLKNVQRVVRNWRKCLACKETKKLQRPSKKMRIFFCKVKKMYIQKNDRVCNFHAQSENWDFSCKKTTIFTSKIIDEMVDLLRKSPSSKAENEPPMNIGLSIPDFKQILFELNILENPNKAEKKKITAVKLYIERLHTGQTYKQLGLRYNMSRVSIGKIIKNGRGLLLQHFVRNHIGYNNCNRQWLKDHTTDLARLLYCNKDTEKCVVILDGTYIYTYSSKNYAHQKRTYSGQKHRHLFKIMKFVAVDGTIIDVFGPFAANKNDAEILKIIFEKTSIEKIFNKGDIILVDRGFRDVTNMLKQKQLDVRIPSFIKKGTHGQLTDKQSGQTRLITKMRFVIELANGRMKMKWYLLNKLIPSILTTHLMSDYKIGAAILNAFGKRITCDKEDFSEIGAQMLKRAELKNKLSRIIHTKNFNKSRKHFQSISPSQVSFPTFNQKQLKQFCLGNYAIMQAKSYAANLLKNKNGVFPISIMEATLVRSHFGKILVEDGFTKPMFIFTQINSRFRSNKAHEVYILYDGIDGNRDKFLYYCTCQHGNRVVGCCSHIMTVVWYFGYGRHHDVSQPASHLDDFFDIHLN